MGSLTNTIDLFEKRFRTYALRTAKLPHVFRTLGMRSMPFEEPTEAPKTKMLISESRIATFSIRSRTCGQKMSSFVETIIGFTTTFITFASSYDMLLALKAMPIIFASSSVMLPMLLATTLFLVSSLKI
jgi:hypothetical protein